MKMYLSSYKIGNHPERLKEMVPKGKKMGFVPNANDAKDSESWHKSQSKNIAMVQGLGIEVEMLNLVDYFGKPEELREKLAELGGVWVRRGNTFILRQAMRSSGFDEIIHDLKNREDFLYSGDSAGVCILAVSLRGLEKVDHPEIMPYEQIRDTIWEGLGILPYQILPHYKSDHPESEDVDKSVEYFMEKGIPFRTLKDGDVIILE